MNRERVLIEARVVEFGHGAMFEHHEDGSFEIFDATSLEITSPAEHVGRTLAFFHSEELDEQSPWRQEGRRVRFSIDVDSLDPDRQLFTAAARNLELLTEDA